MISMFVLEQQPQQMLPTPTNHHHEMSSQSRGALQMQQQKQPFLQANDHEQNVGQQVDATTLASTIANHILSNFTANINIPARNIQSSESNNTIGLQDRNLTISTSNQQQLDNIHQAALWLQLPKMDDLTDIFSVCCSTAIIFGGLIPYVPQYLRIKQNSSSEGFSTYVCLTLILANIMRIMFWFGHHFELPLFIQSFVMIAAMMAMMEICVRVRERSTSFTISSMINSSGSSNFRRRQSVIGLNLREFWNWDDLLSYVKFLLLFTLVLSILTYIFLDNYLFIEPLGFIALLTESMLGVPQLLSNYLKKSTRGMSFEMVAMWLSGDLYKTLYYILKKNPIQFPICGSIQVVVDLLIILQVFWYKRQKVTYRKLPKST